MTTLTATTITATNGRTYHAFATDAAQVQFTDASNVRHSFTDGAPLYAVYEDAARLHFVGLFLTRERVGADAPLAFWAAPFVRRITFNHAHTHYMRKCALDGSGVAVPRSRKMVNNDKYAAERRERFPQVNA